MFTDYYPWQFIVALGEYLSSWYLAAIFLTGFTAFYFSYYRGQNSDRALFMSRLWLVVATAVPAISLLTMVWEDLNWSKHMESCDQVLGLTSYLSPCSPPSLAETIGHGWEFFCLAAGLHAISFLIAFEIGRD
jgi:hypothetical protein